MTNSTTGPTLVALHAPLGAKPHKQPSGRYFPADGDGIVHALEHDVADLLLEGYTLVAPTKRPTPAAQG